YFCVQPVACARRDPESKGVVEGGVRYVKHNALAGRADELTRFEDYLALAPYWRDQVANLRQHETTHERPLDRFQQERALLRPEDRLGALTLRQRPAQQALEQAFDAWGP